MWCAVWGWSCSDEQNEHYDRSGALPDETLLDLIRQDSDLSVFSRLVEIAGYNELLSSSQTYTVWAPVNEAFSDINPDTVKKEQAIRILDNHLARFNNSTSIPDGRTIRMKNRKAYSFSGQGSWFSGARLTGRDILARNGLLHTLQERIEFHDNLYEYIMSSSQASKLGDFIRLFDEMKFDEELSTPIGMGENGMVYDSVMSSYNRLFDDPMFGLGQINVEDSVYTMLVPDNNAWDAAYGRISPYFKVYNKDAAYADSLTRVQTSLAILKDLVYRGSILNAPAPPDSLVSTGRSVIHDAQDLFSGSVRQTLSNGLAYETSVLRYNNTETWHKNIYVECENTTGRVASINTSVTLGVTNENTEFQASKGYYIDVQGTTTAANPGVTLPIPDVLSGKYNIYAEFLPTSIGGLPNDSTKLLFELTYLNSNGSTGSKLVNTANLVTSGTKKVKMAVVENFEFPVSNYYDDQWQIGLREGKYTREADWVVTTKLLIRTNVTNAEANVGTFKRRFYVDRIVFESVRD